MKFLRLFIPTIILIFHSLPSSAVLKGDDINETVIMLNSELEVFSKHVNSTILEFSKVRNAYKHQAHEFRLEMASAKLSLYSQQEQYIFGNAYASENAHNLCEDFIKNKRPIGSWETSYNRSLSRCKKLQETLSNINPNSLNDQAKKSRTQGLKHLDCVLADLKEWKDTIDVDLKRFSIIESEVNSLLGEIDANYKYILNSLLLHPDRYPTHKVFGTDFLSQWNSCATSLKDMTTTSNYYGWEFQNKWNDNSYFILFAGIIAFIIGILLGKLVFRWIPKDWEIVHKHPSCLYIFYGWVFVAITYFIIRLFTENPFFISVLYLLIEMCLMCIVLLYSVLLRVRSDQLKSTILSYLPITLLSLSIILYRIALVNIFVIRITYPIILLILIAVQFLVIRYSHKDILRFDRNMSFVAFVLFISCFILNFFGYYYLSIHFALVWSVFVIGFLVLSCYFYYLDRCERYWRQKEDYNYTKSWKAFTFPRLFKPMSIILIFSLCTLECAHVFNINDWLNELYSYNFINRPGFVCISLRRILHIVISAILTHYLVGLANYMLRIKYKEKAEVGALNLGRNIFVIVVWSIFIVVALAYIEVNSIGIIATLGGLAVGLGVALRDTFDCLLCGIILMMGRIKIGDVVEVGNDIRGKVIDIQYRTTLIETDDGANISVFNTQFFGKDFRNVSYSGKYQRLHLSFKVQKEIDAPKVREMLAQALIDGVPELAKSPAPKILFGASDRFHVDMIAQVWVPVMDYYEAISNVKETLFNTLKAHGMSNMSVDSRVRIIKNMVEETSVENKKK